MTPRIRPTRSKTRKGVLKWLASLTPWTSAQHLHALDASDAVAVHIDAYTGHILSWEMPNGDLISAPGHSSQPIPWLSPASYAKAMSLAA